jgi:hypothetical protein
VQPPPHLFLGLTIGSQADGFVMQRTTTLQRIGLFLSVHGPYQGVYGKRLSGRGPLACSRSFRGWDAVTVCLPMGVADGPPACRARRAAT